jgi:hypothetical protein
MGLISYIKRYTGIGNLFRTGSLMRLGIFYKRGYLIADLFVSIGNIVVISFELGF